MRKYSNSNDSADASAQKSINQGSYNETSGTQGTYGYQTSPQKLVEWICPNDETVNTGDSCIICGHRRPLDADDGEEHTKKKVPLPVLIGIAALIALVVCFFAVHIWDDATCTEPAKCIICGKRRQDAALGHSWKAANCETAQICSRCGETSGSPLGHNWKAATCESAKKCSRCGKTSGSPLGHNWQAATCESPKTCKTCGKVEGSAAGHQWIEATYSTPKSCKICGATQGYVKGYIPTASGHFSEEQISFGNTNWNSFIFDSPLKGCTKFTFNLTVSNIEQGKPFGTWRVYMRNKWGGWAQIGSIKLESYSASSEISLDTPTTISEIFVGAPYGWSSGFSASFYVTDIYTREDS